MLSSQNETERTQTQKTGLPLSKKQLTSSLSIKPGNSRSAVLRDQAGSVQMTEQQKAEEVNNMLVDRLHDNLVRS